MHPVRRWFKQHVGPRPFGFQEQAWEAQLAGRSGLIHAPTGMGKTLSAFLPSLMRWVDEHLDTSAWAAAKPEPLRVLWITPLRALASDTEQALRRPCGDLGLPWTVGRRTGDVSSTVKAKQRKAMPSVLVTTPESLSVLLSYPESQRLLGTLWTVVCDEWHELMSTKRGTQAELGLARLRAWNPGLTTWGLSATLGNLGEAMGVLLGGDPGGASGEGEAPAEPRTPAADGSAGASPSRDSAGRPGVMVQGQQHKEVRIDTLIPPDIERFPWAGHLGIRMLEPVIEAVESARTTLVFTNTRSQSEIWFSRITQAKPDWARDVALHHGSIDREVRDAVEDRLRAGDIRCVVCTSSLDLGVDFSPVDQVIQIGSPKGVARLLQRAGRSGHQPGAVSRVVGVPTNAFELVEFAAARDAAQRREIESRPALNRPLDVLVQHLVTVGMGGGFDLDAMYDEVQTTHAYAGLSEQEWDWCLDFCTRGGDALKAYPEYAKLVPDPDDAGRLKVGEPRIARLHRMGIGTITSSTAMLVKLVRGRTLGTVEEGFIGKLRPGDRFVFAGQALELVRTRSMTAEVRRAKSPKGAIPTWQGGKSPLSTQLAAAVRRKLHESNRPAEDPPEDDPSIDPEMQAMAPLLQLQRRVSMLPGEGQLLLERVDTEAGHHHFLYPLQGRLVHEGLGALLAFRLARREPNTINVTVNDYGLELLTTRPLPDVEAAWREALSAEGLLDDLLACVNSSELARRRFRDIARIAGLVFQGYPGQGKSARQLQASSELFFDVLKDFDPENLLLDQARREVLDRELEVQRLRGALEALSSQELIFRRLDRLSPLSFPLFAESLREQHVSTESWEDRLRELAAQLEAQLDGEDPGNEPGAASPDSERPRVKGGRRRKRRVVKER